MITRREVEAQEKLARADVRGAKAKEKYYAALLEVVAPKKPSSAAKEPPILSGKAKQKENSKKG